VPEPIRVVLVDDETPARSLLREYLGAHPDVSVVGECANGFEAVKRIPELAPHVVFLDVQMPKLDGFEVLELLEPDSATGRAPAVIFCTAYDEYALRAFEVHAVDYLLKPFGRERLAEALDRARERLALAVRPPAASGPDDPSRATPATASSPAALARTARGPGRFAERIVVRDGAQVHVLHADGVDFVEAQDDYVSIHAGGRAHLKHQALSELAESLDPARFVRVHRSYVVNVERIARIELLAKDQRVAVLRDGRQVPVSRSGQERLKEVLG
jgi:two-component system LytT family response regulator